MKKLFAIVLSMVIVIAASAQYKVGGHYSGNARYYSGNARYYRPHTTRVIVGVNAGYSPYYSPFYPYGYSSAPRYYRPSGLELRIEDIQADYKDRIYSVRHDRSMSKREKKNMIQQLKSDRDLAIRDAERSYYN